MVDPFRTVRGPKAPGDPVWGGANPKRSSTRAIYHYITRTCQSQNLEEDKRATTNVQNGLVFFSLFSKKGLKFERSPGGKVLKKCGKVRKSVKKCRNDFAL